MSYKPQSLFRLLEDIDAGRLLLPHIQRPFVWDVTQIERLFDSLMRDYPIQTFLFWRTTEGIRARKFMQTVDHDADLSTLYDMNKSAKGVEKVFVLDGQQRLQSLHSLFRGSISAPGAPAEAYCDITAGQEVADGDLIFKVQWHRSAPSLPWFRIRDLAERYGNGNAQEVGDTLNDRLATIMPESDSDRLRLRERRVRVNLTQLSNLLNQDKFFWIDELDGVAKSYPYRRILEIFVRVNSGGTKLSAGDLMFAAMKEGSEEIEARVEQTVDLLNGGRLLVESELILKALLLAAGEGAELGPSRFDGDTGSALLKKMEDDWPRSEQAFLELRDLMVHGLHLHADRLVRSYNALIPLFLYLYLHPQPDEASRVRMIAYFHKAQLFGWFGRQGDAILNVLAGIVRKKQGKDFPLDEITDYFRGRYEVAIGDEHLGQSLLRPILLNIVYSELWGSAAFDVAFRGNEPHVDHIYPQHMLRTRLGCGGAEINDLGNLRFVGATDNIRKRAELPDSYFSRLKAAKVAIERHLVVEPYASNPKALAFDRQTYDDFRRSRREKLLEILQRVVNAEGTPRPATATSTGAFTSIPPAD